MNRLRLGLTDYERRAFDDRRRARNCFLALGLLIVFLGVVGSV